MTASICPRCQGNCRPSAHGFIRCPDCAWEGRETATGDGEARAAGVLVVERVVFNRAKSADASRGLLGFVTAHLVGGLVLDNMALRRTRDGRRILTWPSRRDALGGEHPHFRLPGPLQVEIEQQAIAMLAPRFGARPGEGGRP